MRIFLLVLLPSLLLYNCNGLAQKKEQTNFNVTKSDKEWKSILTEKEYYVMRKKAQNQLIQASSILKKLQVPTFVKGATPAFKVIINTIQAVDGLVFIRL